MRNLARRTRLLTLVAALWLGAAWADGSAPLYPPFGVDLSARDLTVRPGDSFFGYANGAWIARTEIPADKPFMTTGQVLRDRAEVQLRTLIESAAAHTSHEPTTVEGKVGAYFKAFVDEAHIESLGLKPLAPELEGIANARSRADLAQRMGRGAGGFEGAFFSAGIDADLKDPAHYAVYLGQAGLTLPDRDYYLKPEFATTRQAFERYATELLTLAGDADAAAEARAILALETRIAEASWTKVEQRDLPALYNPMTPAELEAFAPGFPWKSYLAGAGLGHKGRVIVAEKTAFPKIAQVYAATELPLLKAWLRFTVLDRAAPYLPARFDAAHFELHDHVLQGIAAPGPRWRRGIRAVSGGDCGAEPDSCFGSLDWAVGELYTARYFPPETKARIEALVRDVIAAYRERIAHLDWMGEATRAEALRKLDTYVVKVGYPDHRRDYSGVVVRDDEALGNARRAAAADWAFYVGRSDGPVDKSDWSMTPQTVDAYNGSLRDIVFPAAILQAPNFDPAADDAANYGAIGTVIGHELTHGFDDQGRTIDAAGALRDWWTAADAAAFKARAARLGAQYATYEPVAGMHINPDLTMGENIADLGGVAIALDAYHASLHGHAAPVLAGLTGDQRFFLAYAQVWRGKVRDDAIRRQVVSDPHSFRRFRVDGVVRNLDAWYAAFEVLSGTTLYLAPPDRVRIW
ncbi:MAG: M13 family metallopeptidase [Proteobacteria bacterium]|nr:M13 family metallopeptidase [Pseudomonadota bacterium]